MWSGEVGKSLLCVSNGINIIVNQQIFSAQADTASGNTGCLTLVCRENGNSKTLTKKTDETHILDIWGENSDVPTAVSEYVFLVVGIGSYAINKSMCRYNTITRQHILDICMPLLCKSFMIMLVLGTVRSARACHHTSQGSIVWKLFLLPSSFILLVRTTIVLHNNKHHKYNPDILCIKSVPVFTPRYHE